MSSVTSFGATLVDQAFLQLTFMWPLIVASKTGKCFVTLSDVKPDHVANLLLSMALVHVVVVGLKAAAWKYCISSAVVVFSYALRMYCVLV